MWDLLPKADPQLLPEGPQHCCNFLPAWSSRARVQNHGEGSCPSPPWMGEGSDDQHVSVTARHGFLIAFHFISLQIQKLTLIPLPSSQFFLNKVHADSQLTLWFLDWLQWEVRIPGPSEAFLHTFFLSLDLLLVAYLRDDEHLGIVEAEGMGCTLSWPPKAPEQGLETELDFEDAPGILRGDRLWDEIAY